MAYRVTYTATVTGFSAREVCCAHCGEEYLFDVRRDAASMAVGGGGANPHARFEASDRAQQEVNRSLQTATDVVPCPTCGCYQPNMVAHLKKQHRRWLGRFGILALLAAILPILALQGNPPDPDSTLAVGVALVALGAGLLLLRACLVARHDPNAGDPAERIQLGRARAYRPADANALVNDRQHQAVPLNRDEVGARPLVTAVMGWLFALVGLFVGLGFGVSGLGEVTDASDSPKWPTATGRIVHSSRVETRRQTTRGPRTDVTLHFDYAYTVKGQNYLSEKVKFSMRQGTDEAVRRYQQGAEVRVFYKPDDPKVAVLEPGLTFPDGYHTAGVGVLLLLGALGLFCYGNGWYRRYKQLKEPWKERGPTWRETPVAPPASLAQPLIGLGRGAR